MNDKQSQEYSYALLKKERKSDIYEINERGGEYVVTKGDNKKVSYDNPLTDDMIDKVTKIFGNQEKSITNPINPTYDGDIANYQNENNKKSFPDFYILNTSIDKNIHNESITRRNHNHIHSKSNYEELSKDYLIEPLNQSEISECDEREDEFGNEDNGILFDDKQIDPLFYSGNKSIANDFEHYYDTYKPYISSKINGSDIKLVKDFESQEPVPIIELQTSNSNSSHKSRSIIADSVKLFTKIFPNTYTSMDKQYTNTSDNSVKNNMKLSHFNSKINSYQSIRKSKPYKLLRKSLRSSGLHENTFSNYGKGNKTEYDSDRTSDETGDKIKDESMNYDR
ncbi:unnamed protein product [Gordionus sp. m RMFG-2023]